VRSLQTRVVLATLHGTAQALSVWLSEPDSSSRRLEAECRRNVEVMWLLERLYPDHKSIAEFRRVHRDAVTSAGAELVRFAKSCGLIRGEWIAVDGSKFRAVASVDSNRERIALQRYLDGVDKADEEQLLLATAERFPAGPSSIPVRRCFEPNGVSHKSDQVEADGMDEEQATTKARETDRRERRQRRSRRLRWGLICRVAGGRAGPGRRWISCGRRVR
jgi:hypothetical protein